MNEESLKRGAKFDRYEIRELLGQGGMGKVYRAWDPSLHRDVAIKVLNWRDPFVLRRFAKEAEVIGQLNNPNILEILDYRFEGDLPYLVMEFLRGENLGERLKRGSFKVTSAVDILLGTCNGVIDCHGKGIIHRDIKPGNVFLHSTTDYGTVVKVLDFGIATDQKRPDDLTQPGSPVGTPKYFSPEQIKGYAADEKSDQYAIGLLTYACLTRSLPFMQENEALKEAILKGEYENPRAKNSEIPVGLEQIVLKAMHVNRDERFENVLEFALALTDYASQEGQEFWKEHLLSYRSTTLVSPQEKRGGESLRQEHQTSNDDVTRVDPVMASRLAQKSREESTTRKVPPPLHMPQHGFDEDTSVDVPEQNVVIPVSPLVEEPRVRTPVNNPWTDTRDETQNEEISFQQNQARGVIIRKDRPHPRKWLPIGVLLGAVILGGIMALLVTREPLKSPTGAEGIATPASEADAATDLIVGIPSDALQEESQPTVLIQVPDAEEEKPKTLTRSPRTKTKAVKSKHKPSKIEYTPEGSPILD